MSNSMALIFLRTGDCPRLGVAGIRKKREANLERRMASGINNNNDNKSPRRGGA
jgi:hypothetical protein